MRGVSEKSIEEDLNGKFGKKIQIFIGVTSMASWRWGIGTRAASLAASATLVSSVFFAAICTAGEAA
jgi:hypothetical protein